jgi:hypothetical protein
LYREETAREAEPATVAGSVTGYRWWTLPAPDWQADPGAAEAHWPYGRLHGVQGDWKPGVNIAHCSSRGAYAFQASHPAPAKGCGCGFWAYWQPEQRDMSGYPGVVPVFGVIRAWGRVRLAERGFRAAKAQILAVHLPFVLGAAPRPVWYNALETMAPVRSLTPAEADHAEAWIAVTGDRLEGDYGVRVFETRNALLACYPPDPEGVRRMAGTYCGYCGAGLRQDRRGHDPGCPDGR